MSPSTSSDRAFWNEQARTYGDSWETRGKSAMGERELALLTRFGNEEGAERALDIGIGTGRVLNHYLTATHVRKVYGMDAAENMADVCRRRFDGEPRLGGIVVGDLSAEIPFLGMFDLITAIRVLKYEPSWASVIGRVADHLRVGGVLLFSMPNSRSLNMFSRPYGVRWHATTTNELRSVCEAAGLDPVVVQGATRLPYSLYERSDNAVLCGILKGADSSLDRLLGRTAGVRELFVAARRR